MGGKDERDKVDGMERTRKKGNEVEEEIKKEGMKGKERRKE